MVLKGFVPAVIAGVDVANGLSGSVLAHERKSGVWCTAGSHACDNQASTAQRGVRIDSCVEVGKFGRYLRNGLSRFCFQQPAPKRAVANLIQSSSSVGANLSFPAGPFGFLALGLCFRP